MLKLQKAGGAAYAAKMPLERKAASLGGRARWAKWRELSEQERRKGFKQRSQQALAQHVHDGLASNRRQVPSRGLDGTNCAPACDVADEELRHVLNNQLRGQWAQASKRAHKM